MKKIILTIIVLIICINLSSCGALSALRYSISGEFIAPVDGFSRGDDSTLVLDGNNYILIEDFVGDFSFLATENDILLGEVSNFPFFSNFGYYANAEKNADYIVAGSKSNEIMTSVYLREDIYQEPICYVLQDTDYEFEFLSAFIQTDEVNYEKDIEGKDYKGTTVQIYVKDYPRLVAKLEICEINEKWYCFGPYDAFALSESFLSALVENKVIS